MASGGKSKPGCGCLGLIVGLVAVFALIGSCGSNDDPATTTIRPLASVAQSESAEPVDEPEAEPTLTAAEQKAQDAADAKAEKKAAAKKKAAAEKKAKARAKEKAAEKRDAAQLKADELLTFDNCPDMNRTYPHGVGEPGARDDSSGPRVTSFKVSEHIYELNSSSDRDGDGIACEKR